MSKLTITSSAFEDGEPIPQKHGKAYENVNPPLRLGGVPDEAESLALVVDDPDAPSGTFTHWLAWNIPPDIGEIPEGWTPPETVRQGENDFGNTGYDGPKPPSKHTYRFTVSALDSTLDISQGATASELEPAINSAVLSKDRLTGTFAP